VQRDNSEASCVSSPGRDARRGAEALLLLAAVFSSPTAAAQRTPQPIFTELFAYDPVAPSKLLGKWLISSQLDSKLQPLRVGVVEDRIGKTVGRITVQEGDGLAGANEAMLEARRFICSSEGSRAAAVATESGGVVPSERAEIQIRSNRATGAGELVKFGELVWYRFSFNRQRLAAGRSGCGTSALPDCHPPNQAGFRPGWDVVRRQPLLQDRGAAARRARAFLRAGGHRHTVRPAADGKAHADLPMRPAAGELDHGARAPQSRP
jgi:hypothetical protein